MTELPTDIPPKIDKYTIERLLGQGAMGVVYQGLDTKIERPVAIKVLHEHLRQGEQGADLENRFLQEAKAAARCLHPNIVTIFDYGSYGGKHYIAMEYVKGIELKAHLKADTQITLASAADITIQVLQALEHAHSKGIVHRDIKPANIILLEDGSVKVSDFGVARLDTSDLTNTGFMIGTPNYMSPEGLQGQTVDHRSDLYSVGVLFYELLTRRRPMKGVSLEDSIEQLDMVPHLSIQNIQSIKPILLRALQPISEVRFQSASDFIKRLKEIEDMDLTEAETAFFPSPTIKQEKPEQNSDPSRNLSVSQWNDDVLTTIEKSLAKFLGPMARVLVKKNSTKSESVEELSAKLALHIPNQPEREQFMQILEQTGVSQAIALFDTSSSKQKPSRTPNSTTPISVEQSKALTQLMAFYVGPLAPRLVKQSSKICSDINQLIDHLASHVPTPSERKQFMQRALSIIS